MERIKAKYPSTEPPTDELPTAPVTVTDSLLPAETFVSRAEYKPPPVSSKWSCACGAEFWHLCVCGRLPEKAKCDVTSHLQVQLTKLHPVEGDVLVMTCPATAIPKQVQDFGHIIHNLTGCKVIAATDGVNIETLVDYLCRNGYQVFKRQEGDHFDVAVVCKKCDTALRGFRCEVCKPE
jgi:hypothetical protein